MTFMTEIYELVRHGGGGFTYEELYKMPLHIRRFNYNMLLKEFRDKEEQQKTSSNKQELTVPEHVKSDYAAKARRK